VGLDRAAQLAFDIELGAMVETRAVDHTVIFPLYKCRFSPSGSSPWLDPLNAETSRKNRINIPAFTKYHP
jgi:hypothetical protein